MLTVAPGLRALVVGGLTASIMAACGGDDGSSPAGDSGDGGSDSTHSDSTSGDSTSAGGSGDATSAGGSGASGGSAGEGGTAGSGSGGVASCDSGDTVTLGDTVYDEAQSSDDPSVCDPQIMAVHYDDLTGAGPGFNLLLHYDWDADGKAFDNFATINVYGTGEGDYPIGFESGQASFFLYLPDGYCLASEGTVTLTRVGDTGGVVEGTLQIDAFYSEVDACPETLAGSFRMTIIDESALAD